MSQRYQTSAFGNANQALSGCPPVGCVCRLASWSLFHTETAAIQLLLVEHGKPPDRLMNLAHEKKTRIWRKRQNEGRDARL